MGSLRRQRRKYRDRPTHFAPWPAGRSLGDVIGGVTVTADWPEVLYTTGPAPGVPELRAIVGSDPGPGWVAESHYLTLPGPVLRFRHESGRRLEIHRAASWFGEGDYPPVTARAAWNLLGSLVRGAFNEGHLLATPAGTGRYLLARSISGDREWPVLELETQDFIRATTGQGRIQMFGREGSAPLVQYDARLAYGALCSTLPAGQPSSDTIDAFAGWHAPGRYLVRFGIPRRWHRECDCGAPGHAGIGLLPVRGDDRWEWPADPGSGGGPTWVDAREVAVALAHGWRVQILERMLYPTPPYPAAARRNGQTTRRGPLDAWATKLAGLRSGEGATVYDPTHPLLNNALRAILLYGIGALHGSPRRVTRTISADDARAGLIPATARDVLPLGDRFVWTETEPNRWPEMSHPEWSAAIWARARVALLSSSGAGGARVGMLHVPAETVVGCFTDAIYLTSDPQWSDDGRIGRFRRVWGDELERELPSTALELRRRKALA